MITNLQVLFLTAALISLLTAGLIYLIFQEDSDRSARLWIIGSLMMSLGMTLLIFRPYLSSWLAFGLTNYIMLQAIVLYAYSVKALYNPTQLIPKVSIALCISYGFIQWSLDALNQNNHLALTASIAWAIAYFWTWMSTFKIPKDQHDAPFKFFTILALFGAAVWGARIYLVTSFDIELATDFKTSNFISILLAHFVLMLQQISYLTMRLKDEKGKKQQITELKNTNEKLWLERRSLLLEKENSRNELLQDMHDGFGSKLVSAQLLAERGALDASKFTEYLKEMISDLHLIVDTLDHEDQGFEDSLIDFKYRIAHRMPEGLPNLSWEIELDGIPEIAPRVTLNLLRILQEALTNTLKHAHANNIKFLVNYAPNKSLLTLKTSDDGIGLPDTYSIGQGLNNMKQRARKVGANLSIVNSGKGTDVCLELIL